MTMIIMTMAAGVLEVPGGAKLLQTVTMTMTTQAPCPASCEQEATMQLLRTNLMTLVLHTDEAVSDPLAGHPPSVAGHCEAAPGLLLRRHRKRVDMAPLALGGVLNEVLAQPPFSCPGLVAATAAERRSWVQSRSWCRWKLQEAVAVGVGEAVAAAADMRGEASELLDRRWSFVASTQKRLKPPAASPTRGPACRKHSRQWPASGVPRPWLLEARGTDKGTTAGAISEAAAG